VLDADRRLYIAERRLIARATSTTDVSTTTTTDWTDLTCTFDAHEGHTYVYELDGHYFSTVAADVVRFFIANSANSQRGHTVTDNVVSTINIGNNFDCSYYEDFVNAEANVTRKVRVQRAAGAGTAHGYADATRVASLFVWDCGFIPGT
jgi:hypothetical protein